MDMVLAYDDVVSRAGVLLHRRRGVAKLLSWLGNVALHIRVALAEPPAKDRCRHREFQPLDAEFGEFPAEPSP